MDKIGIIGAGQVGATLAFLTLVKKLADVALIDIQEGLAEGKALDMAQAGTLLGFENSVAGGNDFSDLKGCGITVVTAGLPRKPGMDRLDLLRKNADIVSSVVENIVKHAPGCIIILVTNPLDVMTYLAYKKSGFPANRVMGQAGVLDSARFRHFISEKTGAPAKAVSTFVLGGHGDTMVPLISHTSISGKPITETLPPEEIDALAERTRTGGAEIVSLLKTGSAYYAPAASTLEMVEAIVRDSGAVLPVSAYLNGEYGLSDIYIGVPASLGKEGIKNIIETEITPEEKNMLHSSAEIYKKSIGEIAKAMRKVSSGSIYEAVKKLWVEIAFNLPADVKKKLESAQCSETNPGGRDILSRILENAAIAEREKIPMCQDTGFPLIFIERGQDIVISGGDLFRALERAVHEGTEEAGLRASVVKGPFKRENTGGNIPPAVHSETVPGGEFRITVSAKGAGSENAGLLAMLKPGDGRAGVKKVVCEHVKKYAANACPPLVIGVGAGGTADMAALMAKKACLQNLEAENPAESDFEAEILEDINASGIGPGGFGGDTTALAVKVRTFACHIASLPVAVSINCHAVRRKEILL